MKNATLIICMVVCLGLFVRAPSALAQPPLDVDCDCFLAATICADEAFPPNYFANMGDLVSTAMRDPFIFGMLAFLLHECSGSGNLPECEGEEPILLESPQQAMATYGSCGMIPDFIDQVYD